MATHAHLLRRLAVLAVLLFITLPSTGLALTQVSGFGSNPGNLLMYKYVPAGLPSGAPLVVALHGCTQQASAYDAETGWEMLADRWKFALLLPEQQSGNNSSRCFNWFEPGDISRGQGEVEFYADGSLLGVDQQAPYGWSWDTSAVAAGAHELSAKAYDAAGNVGSAAVVPVTIDGGGGGGGGSLSLSSQAADDGYVKATASDGSPAVGTLEAYYGLALGRGSDSKYNRALLSFDTSAIPAGATIMAARLRLTHRGGSGDPWSGGNSLVV
ncbi:MAG: hypothetical protein KDI37_16950, partial [Xanthomonadales bacterium]|nr:hypothetical protein [Xanthomonadales bacterium]